MAEVEPWVALQAVGKTVAYEPGEVILRTDGSDTVAVLTEGVVVQRAIVDGTSRAVEVLFAPAFVGDVPSDDDGAGKYQMEYVASKPVVCVVISWDTLAALPVELVVNVTQLVIRRLRASDARMVSWLSRSANS